MSTPAPATSAAADSNQPRQWVGGLLVESPATSAAGEWKRQGKVITIEGETFTCLSEASAMYIVSTRNMEVAALREQLEQLQAWKDYAEGLGLRIGLCKSSDCPEGRLAHDLAEGSELHRIFDEWSHSIGMAEQLATAQKEASEAQAALRQKDEALQWALDTLDDTDAYLHKIDSANYEKYLNLVCDRIAKAKARKALAIQSGSSALNAVIEAAMITSSSDPATPEARGPSA